jgi:hypothetical protein
MNRRAFLTRVSTGLVGAAVIANVPVTWLPAPVRRYAALEYLRNAYNYYVDLVLELREREPDRPADMPAAMVVQTWLYEQAEGEMAANKRFRELLYMRQDVPVPHMLFKSIILTYDDVFVTRPREVRVLDPDQWARYLGGKALPQFRG